MSEQDGIPIENPTYLADIRHFFAAGDIACMRGNGIDLGTYDGLRSNALRVFFRTREGTMPPQETASGPSSGSRRSTTG